MFFVAIFYGLRIERYGYKMIKSFLDELYQKNMDESYMLNKKSMDVLNKIKETDKFIELLDEKNDPNFEIFTPREVNPKNKEQIKDLREKKKELQEEYASILDQVKNLSEQSKHLQSVIEENSRFENEHRILQQRYTYEKKRLDQIVAYVSREIEKKSNVVEDAFEDQNQKIQTVSEYQQIKNKLDLVLGIFDLDRNRSKMELRQMKNILDKLVENNSAADNDHSETIHISDENEIVNNSKEDIESSLASLAYQTSSENESWVLQNKNTDCAVTYDEAFDTRIEGWMSGDDRIMFDYMLNRIIHSLSKYTDQILVQLSENQTVRLQCTVDQQKEEEVIQYVKKESNTLLNILLDVAVEIEKNEDSNIVVAIEKVEKN